MEGASSMCARVLSPSREATRPWIHAERKGEGPRNDAEAYAGKWLVFVPRARVDAVWERIRQATEEGRLGIAAKVSTSRPSGYRSTDHVICVYTRDCRDRTDVSDTLKGLRAIRVRGKLYYKTDQATLDGVYSAEGPFTRKQQRASLYSSDDFEK